MVGVGFFLVLGKCHQSYLLALRRSRGRLFDLFLYFGIFGLFLFLLNGGVHHGLCGPLDYSWSLLLS